MSVVSLGESMNILLFNILLWGGDLFDLMPFTYVMYDNICQRYVWPYCRIQQKGGFLLLKKGKK